MQPARALVLVDNERHEEARLNLALEEFIVRRYDVSARAFCLLYANAPSVIVGKHQNVWEEVNVAVCRRQHIPILRRISGGGAVYHDRGNLNIAFITRHTMQNFNNYRSFLQPIVQALAQLHIAAGMDARNNLLIAGKKISGNAQFTSRQTLLSHGTLLFNSDLEMLRSALKVNRRKIVTSKGTRSTPASVTNVAAHLKEPLDMTAFCEYLQRALSLNEFPAARLSAQEWGEVRQLADRKYGDWEWNYGRSPACVIEKNIGIAGKAFPLHVHIDKGRIAALESTNGKEPAGLREVRSALEQIPYEYDTLSKAINSLNRIPQFNSFDLSGLLEDL